MPSWSRTRNSEPRALVEDREHEHAAKAREATRSPTPPRFEHDLGVAGGAKRDPRRRELAANGRVVVQLAVVRERQTVLGERLRRGRRQVDDREPAVAERDGQTRPVVLPHAVAVGTAVRRAVG